MFGLKTILPYTDILMSVFLITIFLSLFLFIFVLYIHYKLKYYIENYNDVTTLHDDTIDYERSKKSLERLCYSLWLNEMMYIFIYILQ